MNTQNIYSTNYTSIDVVLDNSEYFDQKIATSEDGIEEGALDVVLDSSDFYDFFLTNIEIDLNSLPPVTPNCGGECESTVVGILSGPITTDNGVELITDDGVIILF